MMKPDEVNIEEVVDTLFAARGHVVDAEMAIEDFESVSGCILSTRKAISRLEKVLSELEAGN
jgi:BMFP domain-containing protein YqiC